jgi:hypothetical protein
MRLPAAAYGAIRGAPQQAIETPTKTANNDVTIK